MVEKIAYAHIEQDNDRVPYLTGTKIQVKQVALDHIAYQWSAEDIRRNHPHLSLAQIHSALGQSKEMAIHTKIVGRQVALRPADRRRQETPTCHMRRVCTSISLQEP